MRYATAIRATLCLLTAACLLPATARAQSDQQALVDRATLSVQEIVGNPPDPNVVDFLRKARGVMVCPRLFKASFLLGGQGGSCVLLARDGAGSWSDPAFYSLGSGSFGFQVGIQDSALLMAILTDKGLASVMDDQLKLGASADLAIASYGGGAEAATTAAIGADIIAFQKSRGLFAGISLSGSIVATDTKANNAYYGKPLAARQITMQMEVNNPGADPLRAILMRYGAPAAAPAPRLDPPPGAPPPTSPAPTGAVRSQPLAAPR